MTHTQWPPWAVVSLQRKLDQLTEAVRNRPASRTDDDHIWLTRFLLVRICGYLEQVVHEAIRGYVGVRSFGLVKSFAISHLSMSRNPTPSNLLALVGRLDSNLCDELQELLEADDQRLHRELSKLVAIRNLIAHGHNEGLTPTRALALRNDADLIAEWFLTKFDPN